MIVGGTVLLTTPVGRYKSLTMTEGKSAKPTCIRMSTLPKTSVVHNLVRGTGVPIPLTWTAFDPTLVKRVILTPAITIPKLLPRRSEIAAKYRLIK